MKISETRESTIIPTGASVISRNALIFCSNFTFNVVYYAEVFGTSKSKIALTSAFLDLILEEFDQLMRNQCIWVSFPWSESAVSVFA